MVTPLSDATDTCEIDSCCEGVCSGNVVSFIRDDEFPAEMCPPCIIAFMRDNTPVSLHFSPPR